MSVGRCLLTADVSVLVYTLSISADIKKKCFKEHGAEKMLGVIRTFSFQ